MAVSARARRRLCSLLIQRRVELCILAPLNEAEKASKHEMLHDRQLAEHFRFKHLHHALVHPRPRFDGGNVIEHWRVPAQRGRFDLGRVSALSASALSTTHRVDKLYTRKVHVVWAERFQHLWIMDSFRAQVLVIYKTSASRESLVKTLTPQLCTTPQKRQEVIIIQAPDTMGASRLEPVGRLKITHHVDVPGATVSGDNRLRVVTHFQKIPSTIKG